MPMSLSKFLSLVNKHYNLMGDCITQRQHSCFSPSGPVFDSRHSPKIYFDAAEIHRRGWLEKRGPWLENFDRTHLGSANGNLLLQKHLNLK